MDSRSAGISRVLWRERKWFAIGLMAAIAVAAVVVPLSLTKPAAQQDTTSPIADLSASPLSPSPSPSPGPTATEPAITPEPAPQTPGVLTSIHCGTDKAAVSQPVVSDGRMYAICGNDIVVVDLTTDKVVRTYKSVYAEPKLPDEFSGPDNDLIPANTRTLIVNSGLWIDDSWAGTAWRVDPESGHVTKKISGSLAGDWGGYVWLSHPRQSGLQGADPASGALGPKLDLPQSQYVTYACGSLWSSDNDTLHRYDLDGNPLWRATATDLGSSTAEMGGFQGVVQVGGECWAEFSSVGSTAPNRTVLTRLGGSCITGQSPDLGGDVYLLGDTLWLATWSDEMNLYRSQRLDLSTWQTRGPAWNLPSLPYLMAADGQVWTWNTNDVLQRLDVLLEEWPYTPTPALACPTAAAPTTKIDGYWLGLAKRSFEVR